jgi:hypothetical protein
LISKAGTHLFFESFFVIHYEPHDPGVKEDDERHGNEIGEREDGHYKELVRRCLSEVIKSAACQVALCNIRTINIMHSPFTFAADKRCGSYIFSPVVLLCADISQMPSFMVHRVNSDISCQSRRENKETFFSLLMKFLIKIVPQRK